MWLFFDDENARFSWSDSSDRMANSTITQPDVAEMLLADDDDEDVQPIFTNPIYKIPIDCQIFTNKPMTGVEAALQVKQQIDNT